MAESEANPRDVENITMKYSVSFPAEFVAHLCGRFPGIYVEVKEDVWPRPKMYDVGPFWSFLYGLHTFTPCSSSAEWMRLEEAAKDFQASTGHKCAPILRVIGDATVYCVDSLGSIWRYDHETNEIAPVTGDFWSVFEHEIVQLKDRKNRKLSST